MSERAACLPVHTCRQILLKSHDSDGGVGFYLKCVSLCPLQSCCYSLSLSLQVRRSVKKRRNIRAQDRTIVKNNSEKLTPVRSQIRAHIGWHAECYARPPCASAAPPQAQNLVLCLAPLIVVSELRAAITADDFLDHTNYKENPRYYADSASFPVGGEL